MSQNQIVEYRRPHDGFRVESLSILCFKVLSPEDYEALPEAVHKTIRNTYFQWSYFPTSINSSLFIYAKYPKANDLCTKCNARVAPLRPLSCLVDVSSYRSMLIHRGQHYKEGKFSIYKTRKYGIRLARCLCKGRFYIFVTRKMIHYAV
jgi:hypothetical protein